MTQKYQVKPQAGYLVVKPIGASKFNETELAIPESEVERISTGEVIDVSEFAGTYENFGNQVSTDVKVGDTIAYIQYSEHPIQVNTEEVHVVRFDRVIAVIEEVK